MQMSSIRRIKDPYELWYEYLKRSENYKEFCEALQAGKSPGATEKNAKLLDVYLSWGDVFKDSFGESYKRFERNRSLQSRRAVVDFKAEFRNIAMNIIKQYKNETGRKISFRVLIDLIERGFKRQTILLMIDPTAGTDEEILAKVKEALKEKRKQPSTKALQLIECVNNRLTTEKPRVENLKIYLMVYDLKKSGMTNSDVIRAFGDPKGEDVERHFKRYKANAIKIIENVEQGIFPGDYPLRPEEKYEYRVRVGQGSSTWDQADATPNSFKKNTRRSR